VSGGNTLVTGTFSSTPSTQFYLEFFGSTQTAPGGAGESEAFLGSTAVTTDATGQASFSLSFPVVFGTYVSATATDPNGNTSEFSLAFPVSGGGGGAAPRVLAAAPTKSLSATLTGGAGNSTGLDSHGISANSTHPADPISPPALLMALARNTRAPSWFAEQPPASLSIPMLMGTAADPAPAGVKEIGDEFFSLFSSLHHSRRSTTDLFGLWLTSQALEEAL
jgi:hypothetical protein